MTTPPWVIATHTVGDLVLAVIMSLLALVVVRQALLSPAGVQRRRRIALALVAASMSVDHWWQGMFWQWPVYMEPLRLFDPHYLMVPIIGVVVGVGWMVFDDA